MSKYVSPVAVMLNLRADALTAGQSSPLFFPTPLGSRQVVQHV